MKRLLICFCAIFLFSLNLKIGVSCEASAFSPYDLSNFGISSLKAVPAGNSPRNHRTSLEKGLRLLSSSGLYEVTDFPKVDEKSFVYQDLSLTYSADKIFVEATYSPAATKLISSVFHPKYGNVFMITLETSLVPGDRVCERMSRLTNTYFFSHADLSCVAVEGMRVRYGADGGSLVARFSPDEERNVCVSPDGFRWNSAAYCSNATLRREGEGDSLKFHFSFSVSIADLATTLSSEEQGYVRRALAGGESFLCGGFDLRPVIEQKYWFSDGVSDMLCLSASLPCNSVSPLSQKGQKWSQFFAEKEAANAANFTHVLAPLYLVGDVPIAPESEKPNSSETSGDLQDETERHDGSESSVAQGLPPALKEPPPLRIPVSENVLSTEEQVPSATSEQFAFWEDLPDWEELPEETEQILNEENEKKTNLLSTLLFVGAGLLLFCSVVGTAILFRVDEKNRKKKKKS